MVDPAVANGKKLFLWCDFSLDGVMSASKCLCPGWEESATIHKGRDYRLFVSFLVGYMTIKCHLWEES